MKKIISMVLFISVFCSLCVPISAVALETHADDSVIYYVEQEIREQDIQRQINEILAELNKREFPNRKRWSWVCGRCSIL